jgi:hypothetical protein
MPAASPIERGSPVAEQDDRGSHVGRIEAAGCPLGGSYEIVRDCQMAALGAGITHLPGTIEALGTQLSRAGAWN